MADEEQQIRELQAARSLQKAAAAATTAKDVSLSSSSAQMDTDIYGGSSSKYAGYMTELPDVEDVDMEDSTEATGLERCKLSRFL